MALWYRIHKKKEIAHVFSGDGGLFVSGRWNHLGRRAVYCSESIALASMEFLSNHGLSISGFTCNRFSIDIPENLITRFELQQLPTSWRATPATNVSRDFADANLFQAGGPLGIAVPSIMVPEEFNLVINPLHGDYPEVLANVRHLGTYQAPVR